MDESYVVVRVLDIVWYPVDMEESDNSLPTSVSRLGFYLTPAEMNKCSADVIENKIEELKQQIAECQSRKQSILDKYLK